ncbi:MAG TPA: nucleoside monophosphate kinase [Candidatus Saccharimonadales bacterium]|nr:nucleoside monophosphate kinase [Candidatus Saccharimonadales bacterium]
MIVFFGPAGAGKSVQGQLLAARNNWRWLSSGQLLRDTHDIELIKEMQTGHLVTPEKVNELMGDALRRAKNVDRVILDGYPRQLSQAKWLIQSQPEHERSIQLVIVLEVPRSELLKRIEVRGRIDDTPDAVDERLRIYRTEIYPILTYLTEQGVNVAHIDGTGSVGQVHDRIMDEMIAHKLA